MSARKGGGIVDPSLKASLRLTSDVNLPCPLDSPIDRADMSPLLEQHQSARPDQARIEPREEEAGPLSEVIGSDPALSRQSA